MFDMSQIGLHGDTDTEVARHAAAALSHCVLGWLKQAAVVLFIIIAKESQATMQLRDSLPALLFLGFADS